MHMVDLGGGGNNVAKSLVGLVAVVIGCVGLGAAYWIDGVTLEEKAYVEVQASVATVAMRTSQDQAGKTVYQPSFSFDFTFNDEKQLVENILDVSFASEEEANAYIAKFPDGTKRAVFVNATAPSRVKLTRTEMPEYLFYVSLGVGILFVLIGLKFLFL